MSTQFTLAIDPARVSFESLHPREDFPIFDIIGTHEPVDVIQQTVDTLPDGFLARYPRYPPHSFVPSILEYR